MDKLTQRVKYIIRKIALEFPFTRPALEVVRILIEIEVKESGSNAPPRLHPSLYWVNDTQAGRQAGSQLPIDFETSPVD